VHSAGVRVDAVDCQAAARDVAFFKSQKIIKLNIKISILKFKFPLNSHLNCAGEYVLIASANTRAPYTPSV